MLWIFLSRELHLCACFFVFGKAAIPRPSLGYTERGFNFHFLLPTKCGVPSLPMQLTQEPRLHSGGIGNSRVSPGLCSHPSFSPPERKWYLAGLGFPLLPSSTHCFLGAWHESHVGHGWCGSGSPCTASIRSISNTFSRFQIVASLPLPQPQS